MPYYKNGMKAAFSIVLLLTKIQKGFIKFLEPADCGMFCPNSIAVVRCRPLHPGKISHKL